MGNRPLGRYSPRVRRQIWPALGLGSTLAAFGTRPGGPHIGLAHKHALAPPSAIFLFTRPGPLGVQWRLLMQRHEVISRALLKAKGRNPKEFFGLSVTDARELIVLAHHCDNELGLKMSAFGPDAVSGVRLELSGKGKTYQVRVSPLGKVTLSTGNQKQLFQAGHFNHLVGGQLFRAIQTEEKQKPWLT